MLLGPGLSSAWAATGTPAATVASEAISRADPVIRALRQDGYTIVSINTTWFNRVRIRARNSDNLREIVVSPSSGAILRDAIVQNFHPQPKQDPNTQTFVPLNPDPQNPEGRN